MKDPWIQWFIERGGKRYLGFAICEGPDGRWWSRDMNPWIGNRSIGTSASKEDCLRACQVIRGIKTVGNVRTPTATPPE